MPQMGSTRVQEDAEGQGVRRQKEEQRRGTKKKKNTRQYRGKDESGGGGERFFANAQNDSLSREAELRMTTESRDKSHNDS